MKKVFLLLSVMALALMPLSASAIPELQLYIEGASYGTLGQDEDTWFSAANPFTLWVLGQTKQNPNAQIVPITDVTLVVTYPKDESGTLTITPTTASASYNTWIGQDPGIPTISGPVGSGDWPDNSIPLPPHFPLKNGYSYFLYSISSFTQADSYVGNWAGSNVPPPDSNPNFYNGEIHAFEIALSGYSYLHFDVYGQQGNATINNPNSHDASYVPLPGALLLLGGGLVRLLARRR